MVEYYFCLLISASVQHVRFLRLGRVRSGQVISDQIVKIILDAN